MRRVTGLLVALVVLAGGCADGETSDAAVSVAPPVTSPTWTPPMTTAPISPTSTTTTTTIPSTTSTTVSETTTTLGVVDGGADYYRYGEDGLFRVQDGVETHLVDDPVDVVWDDHMGGLFYKPRQEITQWLKAGAGPVSIADLDPEDEWLTQGGLRFTGLVEGEPTLFYAGYADPRCYQLLGRGLQTNTVQGLMCLPESDAWFDIGSVGDDLLVGVRWEAHGVAGTAVWIRFWDLDGEIVEVASNPMPDPCAPCELDALISPDGGLLVYRYLPYSEWPPGDSDAVTEEEWWEQTRLIPADVIVLDLEDGGELWREEVAAEIHLADFDGRYLVASTAWWHGPIESTIYDTWGEHEPLAVPSAVTLTR